MRRLDVLLAVILLALPLAAAEGPPSEVLEGVPAALAFLGGDGFVGSYRMSAHAVAQVPGEDEDELEEYLITVHADGSKETRLLRALEHGRDVTAERQREEGEVEVEESDDSHTIELDDFGMLPIGPNRAYYEFDEIRFEGGLAVVSFAPERRHRKRDDLARGRIAWHPDTLEPAWFEIEPNDRPALVKELTMRFEFAHTGGRLYPSRIVTRVRAGLPLFKVKVDVDIQVSDVTPAG